MRKYVRNAFPWNLISLESSWRGGFSTTLVLNSLQIGHQIRERYGALDDRFPLPSLFLFLPPLFSRGNFQRIYLVGHENEKSLVSRRRRLFLALYTRDIEGTLTGMDVRPGCISRGRRR